MVFPDIDPVIFSIGPFALRWYALAYVVGMIGCTYYAIALVKRFELWGDSIPLTEQEILDAVVWLVIGVILGGRLGYVLFYNPAFYFTHPDQILAMWNGGMSFHGGLLGVAIALLLFAHKRNLSWLSFADLCAAITPIALFLGRIANFINGELWGRPTQLPWGIIFPRAGSTPRHPSQLYEAVLEGPVLFIILQLAVFYFAAFKKPGLMSGLFLIGYGVARIIVEFFREPDAQLGYFAQYFTMGMALSLPMVLIGIVFYVRAQR